MSMTVRCARWSLVWVGQLMVLPRRPVLPSRRLQRSWPFWALPPIWRISNAAWGPITIGFTFDDQPVTADDLEAADALTALMRDALLPNLVQTLGGAPAFVHGGPFANIAHGCNTLLATQAALNLGDIALTEAGFGSDLGGE